MQIIKRSHLLPQLHNKANNACIAHIHGSQLEFLLNECNDTQTNTMYCLWCGVYYEKKNVGSLMLLFCNF